MKFLGKEPPLEHNENGERLLVLKKKGSNKVYSHEEIFEKNGEHFRGALIEAARILEMTAAYQHSDESSQMFHERIARMLLVSAGGRK